MDSYLTNGSPGSPEPCALGLCAYRRGSPLEEVTPGLGEQQEDEQDDVPAIWNQRIPPMIAVCTRNRPLVTTTTHQSQRTPLSSHESDPELGRLSLAPLRIEHFEGARVSRRAGGPDDPLRRLLVQPNLPRADTDEVPNADPSAWLEAVLRQSRHPGWRSLDRWRRRNSVLLVGLLGFIEYLLIAIIIFGKLSIVGDVGIALLAAPLGALVLAEGVFAVRPTKQRLARADHLVLVTIGIFFALGLVDAIATAIE